MLDSLGSSVDGTLSGCETPELPATQVAPKNNLLYWEVQKYYPVATEKISSLGNLQSNFGFAVNLYIRSLWDKKD